jgi:hypothetical protein
MSVGTTGSREASHAASTPPHFVWPIATTGNRQCGFAGTMTTRIVFDEEIVDGVLNKPAPSRLGLPCCRCIKSMRSCGSK